MDWEWEMREDDRISLKEEELNEDNCKCPKCGGIMVNESDAYNLTEPYEDKWRRCIECDHTIDRNWSI